MCIRDSRWGGHGHHQHQANPQANAAQPRLHEENNNLPEENAGGYQEPRGLACILGGAQAPISNRHFKQLTREINAALPGVGTAKPLKWSQFAISFDSSDHPKSTRTVGTIPLVCTPQSTTSPSLRRSSTGVQA